MKNWLAAIAIIIFVTGAIYAFGYFFAIPKSALVSVPYKWRSIKLSHKRNVYLNYLGEPVSDNNKWQTMGDIWIIRNGQYIFELRIMYDSDSLCVSRSMRYEFHNWLFDKREVIIEDGVEGGGILKQI